MISKIPNNKLRIKTGIRQTNSVQAEPRSWTKEYLEQIQVVVKARLRNTGLAIKK